jgi:GntR family transcriptional regulator
MSQKRPATLTNAAQPQQADSLVRSSKIPIYHQLYEILRDRILSGEWQAGDVLPPEPELMATFDVSRITVRQAVELLANENLVYKRRGKGTFVSMATLKTDASRLVEFEEDMRGRGLQPTSIVLNTEVVTVSRVTADKMNIEVGDELAFIKRLLLANGEPISLEEIYLVHKYCPGILEGHDYASESLYEVLERDYDIRFTRAEQTISAMVAPDHLQQQLNMSTNEALLFIERITYCQRDRAVKFRRSHYRADRYALQLALNR